jgi:hypothetical protein
MPAQELVSPDTGGDGGGAGGGIGEQLKHNRHEREDR